MIKNIIATLTLTGVFAFTTKAFNFVYKQVENPSYLVWLAIGCTYLLAMFIITILVYARIEKVNRMKRKARLRKQRINSLRVLNQEAV